MFSKIGLTLKEIEKEVKGYNLAYVFLHNFESFTEEQKKIWQEKFSVWINK